MKHNLFNSLQYFDNAEGHKALLYSLPQLEKQGIGPISRLPVSLRIVLESLLRNYDGVKITEENIRELANWQPTAKRTQEIPFVVARIVLQDLMGVPLLADLAAMRAAAKMIGHDLKDIDSLVPVNLVIDHSVQVDYYNRPDAVQKNMTIEFSRNQARYQFLKWGAQAFHNLRIIPPGVGIVHQVNLEYLAKGIFEEDGVYYPDSVVGTDSHTTMIGGLGIVGWGVGGIEAEAGMLGQPIYILMPDVVGVHLTGAPNAGVTATDLALYITEVLRKHKVVGKFVEFYGEGARGLTLPDRATIANMAPEYGATIGYFPVDEESCNYLEITGRPAKQVELFRNYFKTQGMFGIPSKGECDYTTTIELDLSNVTPSVAGPRRPQDRLNLAEVKEVFQGLLIKSSEDNGYNKTLTTSKERFPLEVSLPLSQLVDHEAQFSESEKADKPTSLDLPHKPLSTAQLLPPAGAVVGDGFKTTLGNGDILIAAITSCTNTSNPSVMIGAGLLAKKALERGLTVSPLIKTSLAPGSRSVTYYLEKTGLLSYLSQLGFGLVGYGCTTCIGNAGPLNPIIEEIVTNHDLIGVSVLSGNRNFEARIHPNIKANFLMSPPLVVAFALAGRIDIDLTTEPIGRDQEGKEVYLRELWPSQPEINNLLRIANDPQTYADSQISFSQQNPFWNEIPSNSGELYQWDSDSTYIQEPPFFKHLNFEKGTISDIKNARALAIFGNSVTTDHISPAGAIKKDSPAGLYLSQKGVAYEDFNNYGARRGNDQVMVRGTFANVRIKNLMVPGVEGGVTVYQPSGERLSIYEAAVKYQASNTPLLIIAGQEYGTGSSRDWAAKGTALLGVKVVLAESFERIHRSNLIGMGILPCQFQEELSTRTLDLNGSEVFDLIGLEEDLKPLQTAILVIHRKDGTTDKVPVTVRIDTPVEVEYYRQGGILPYVFRQLLNKKA